VVAAEPGATNALAQNRAAQANRTLRHWSSVMSVISVIFYLYPYARAPLLIDGDAAVRKRISISPTHAVFVCASDS
jgi:hypothetical protein